jgi:hypothetical protein
MRRTGFASECDSPSDEPKSRFVSRGRAETNFPPQAHTELAFATIRF